MISTVVLISKFAPDRLQAQYLTRSIAGFA